MTNETLIRSGIAKAKRDIKVAKKHLDEFGMVDSDVADALGNDVQKGVEMNAYNRIVGHFIEKQVDSIALDPRKLGFTGDKAALANELNELSASLGNKSEDEECGTVHALRNGINAIPDDGSEPVSFADFLETEDGEEPMSLRDIAAKIAAEAKDAGENVRTKARTKNKARFTKDDSPVDQLHTLADGIEDPKMRSLAHDITDKMNDLFEATKAKGRPSLINHGQINLGPGVHAHLVSAPADATDEEVNAFMAKELGVDPEKLHGFTVDADHFAGHFTD